MLTQQPITLPPLEDQEDTTPVQVALLIDDMIDCRQQLTEDLARLNDRLSKVIDFDAESKVVKRSITKALEHMRLTEYHLKRLYNATC